MIRPLLSDLHPTQMRFADGDRLLARVSVDLTLDKSRSLSRSLMKFAQADVRILVLNCLRFRLAHVCAVTGQTSILCGPDDAGQTGAPLPGVMNLSCTVVDLRPNDRLICGVPFDVPGMHAAAFRATIRTWTGPDVEILLNTVRTS